MIRSTVHSVYMSPRKSATVYRSKNVDLLLIRSKIALLTVRIFEGSASTKADLIRATFLSVQ